MGTVYDPTADNPPPHTHPILFLLELKKKKKSDGLVMLLRRKGQFICLYHILLSHALPVLSHHLRIKTSITITLSLVSAFFIRIITVFLLCTPIFILLPSLFFLISYSMVIIPVGGLNLCAKEL